MLRTPRVFLTGPFWWRKFKYKRKLDYRMANHRFLEVVGAVSIALFSCSGIVYFGNKTLDWYLNSHGSNKEYNEKYNLIPEESTPNDEGTEEEWRINIDLDDLVDDEHLTWCDGMKKALAITNPHSSSAVDSLIRDYAGSRGGELIVKDASALYSMIVAPKKESGCDDGSLEEKFIKTMIESHPKATNLMVGTVQSKYVRIVANENGSLYVSNLAGFDQKFSVDL